MIASPRPTSVARLLRRENLAMGSGIVSSVSSFVVSFAAIGALELADYGKFALLTTFMFLIGGISRSSMAETGLGKSINTPPRLRIVTAALVGLTLGAASTLVLSLFISIDRDLAVAIVLGATAAAAIEVARVRLIAQQRFALMFIVECCRIAAILCGLLLLQSTVEGLVLLVAGCSLLVIAAGAAFSSANHLALDPRKALVAALDVLVQRGTGQILGLIVVSGATLSVFGAISAARLAYAPLTTVYSASANMVVSGKVLTAKRLSGVVTLLGLVGGLYASAAIVFDAVLPLGNVLGKQGDAMDGLLLPMAIFVVASGAGPALSSTSRRLNTPHLLLRARLAINGWLLSVASVTVWVLGVDSAFGVAWAYAIGGFVAFGAWLRVFKGLRKTLVAAEELGMG